MMHLSKISRTILREDMLTTAHHHPTPIKMLVVVYVFLQILQITGAKEYIINSIRIVLITLIVVHKINR